MMLEGSVTELYDNHLASLIVETYPADLVERLNAVRHRNVLEIASGSGVATRAMAAGLDASVSITARSVAWQQVGVMRLSFQDGSFDPVARSCSTCGTGSSPANSQMSSPKLWPCGTPTTRSGFFRAHPTSRRDRGVRPRRAQ